MSITHIQCEILIRIWPNSPLGIWGWDVDKDGVTDFLVLDEPNGDVYEVFKFDSKRYLSAIASDVLFNVEGKKRSKGELEELLVLPVVPAKGVQGDSVPESSGESKGKNRK
jgi:hypothetical protein